MPDFSLEFDSLDSAQQIPSHKPISISKCDRAVHNYLYLVAMTFLFYDHLITSSEEIHYLWRRPKTQSAYWFFFNRYFALSSNIVALILEFTSLDPVSCRRFNTARQLLLVVQQVLVCILLTLRIYALYRCSLRILAFMVGSGAVLFGISCYSLFGQKSIQPEQLGGCHVGLSSITAIRIASAWEALFVYDSIIFGLTMFKSWQTRNERTTPFTENPIIYVIFRDGAAYFAIMALANLANILTFYFCGAFMRGGLSAFASSMSVTMMSRLMLNLHRTARTGIYSTVSTDMTLTNMEINLPTSSVELDTLQSGRFSTPAYIQSYDSSTSTR